MSHLLSCCFQTFLPLSFLNVHIQSTHHINAGQLQQNQNVNELFIFCNTKYRKKLIYHKVLLLTNSTFQSLFVYLLCLSLVFETVFIPLINIGLQSTKKVHFSITCSWSFYYIYKLFQEIYKIWILCYFSELMRSVCWSTCTWVLTPLPLVWPCSTPHQQ